MVVVFNLPKHLTLREAKAVIDLMPEDQQFKIKYTHNRSAFFITGISSLEGASAKYLLKTLGVTHVECYAGVEANKWDLDDFWRYPEAECELNNYLQGEQS